MADNGFFPLPASRLFGPASAPPPAAPPSPTPPSSPSNGPGLGAYLGNAFSVGPVSDAFRYAFGAHPTVPADRAATALTAAKTAGSGPHPMQASLPRTPLSPDVTNSPTFLGGNFNTQYGAGAAPARPQLPSEAQWYADYMARTGNTPYAMRQAYGMLHHSPVDVAQSKFMDLGTAMSGLDPAARLKVYQTVAAPMATMYGTMYGQGAPGGAGLVPPTNPGAYNLQGYDPYGTTGR